MGLCVFVFWLFLMVEGSQSARELANALVLCKFDFAGEVGDEMVFVKILNVISALFNSDILFHLTNKNVCELVQSCYVISTLNRLSGIVWFFVFDFRVGEEDC